MANDKVTAKEVRCLSLRQAAAYIGVSQSTFRKMVKSGDVPAPIRITEKRLVWDRKQLDEFIDSLSGF